MSITISGIIGLILTNVFGVAIPESDLAVFLQVGGTIVFGLWAWFGRVRHGDLTWWGGKK